MKHESNHYAELLEVLLSLKKGDLSRRMPATLTGLEGKVADTLNDLIERHELLIQEFENVSQAVGKHGSLTERISDKGYSGSWLNLVNAANLLMDDMAWPTEEIARVIGAVAHGDLTQRMAINRDGNPLRGDFLRSSEVVNTMVSQLSSFASEVTRVAHEVGTEGKLGGQAKVKGVSGTWKDLTDNVNLMASNLTDQVRNIAEVTTAVAKGDMSKKITVDVRGEIQELKVTINTMVDQLSSFASEVTRVAREVGTEGKLGGQATVSGVSGTWKDLTDNVNQLAGNLTIQLRDVSKVATAIAHGDLSRKITVNVKGEILQIKETINTMVDQLGSFASEVTRVAREVGTEGKLGGQAQVPGVSGTWKDLTDNVNMMGNNLTDQVRGIAKIVTAVANGDLNKKLTVEAKGEIASLADTINNMIDTLAIFADQVTTVAREVGTEGKLGGQAKVPGVSGTWKDLTDNVNQLADNLTIQVRAIADVAIAVTEGDLSRSVNVLASGEVEELKNNINEMIQNLRETTQKNKEQDWLKTNLAKFTRMLQGQKDLQDVSRLLLSELAPVVSVQHAVLFCLDHNSNKTDKLKLLASYGYLQQQNHPAVFKLGEGLIGQCAEEKKRIIIKDIPPDYIRIASGLGEAPPTNIVVMPVVFESEVKAVIELASFEQFSDIHLSFLEQLTESIGIVFNTIESRMRTEELLKQSQLLATELQSRQEELQQTNEELEEKAQLLAEQKTEVEAKNREIEYARKALEEKASQLQITSRYKSEFLANMSHELRTPLNSLLILSGQLKENPDKHLSEKEVEFADTIYDAGIDLMTLINDILDLSKIESGTVTLEPGEVDLEQIRTGLTRTFKMVVEEKKDLDFTITIADEKPPTLYTDGNRLLQILKNLLSNAFKFTEKGQVELQIGKADEGWNMDKETLNEADEVLAFRVIDTGIGIPEDKQKFIFEAFQQADGGTSRRYGGTGLGLAISREAAHLLGGELQLTESQPDKGSIFTLYIPRQLNVPQEVKSFEMKSTGTHKTSAQEARKVENDEDLKIDDLDITTDFSGKKMLIVDDDIRNIYAITSVLERHHMQVLPAENGKEALSTLEDEPDIDMVLMDIMMPEMDGYETMRLIRENSNFKDLPILALTAKAMQGDREKCLQAGASDYISKPVDTRQLLSLIRHWMFKNN